MKRFTAFLLTLTLLITLVAVPVSAQENTGPTVQVSSVTAKAGDSNVAVEIFLKTIPESPDSASVSIMMPTILCL